MAKYYIYSSKHLFIHVHICSFIYLLYNYTTVIMGPESEILKRYSPDFSQRFLVRWRRKLNKQVQYMVTNTVMEEQDAVRRCFGDNQHNLRVQENLFGGSEVWGKI